MSTIDIERLDALCEAAMDISRHDDDVYAKLIMEPGGPILWVTQRGGGKLSVATAIGWTELAQTRCVGDHARMLIDRAKTSLARMLVSRAKTSLARMEGEKDA